MTVSINSLSNDVFDLVVDQRHVVVDLSLETNTQTNKQTHGLTSASRQRFAASTFTQRGALWVEPGRYLVFLVDDGAAEHRDQT